MTYVPLSEAKEQLSSLIDDAVSTHEIVHITKHGRPSVVLISEDDLESLHETIFWLSQPGTQAAIDAARAEVDAEDPGSVAALRTEFGLPS